MLLSCHWLVRAVAAIVVVAVVGCVAMVTVTPSACLPACCCWCHRNRGKCVVIWLLDIRIVDSFGGCGGIIGSGCCAAWLMVGIFAVRLVG